MLPVRRWKSSSRQTFLRSKIFENMYLNSCFNLIHIFLIQLSLECRKVVSVFFCFLKLERYLFLERIYCGVRGICLSNCRFLYVNESSFQPGGTLWLLLVKGFWCSRKRHLSPQRQYIFYKGECKLLMSDPWLLNDSCFRLLFLLKLSEKLLTFTVTCLRTDMGPSRTAGHGGTVASQISLGAEPRSLQGPGKGLSRNQSTLNLGSKADPRKQKSSLFRCEAVLALESLRIPSVPIPSATTGREWSKEFLLPSATYMLRL